MNKEELHNIIEEEQPNICQIVAIKNNSIVFTLYTLILLGISVVVFKRKMISDNK